MHYEDGPFGRFYCRQSFIIFRAMDTQSMPFAASDKALIGLFFLEMHCLFVKIFRTT